MFLDVRLFPLEGSKSEPVELQIHVVDGADEPRVIVHAGRFYVRDMWRGASRVLTYSEASAHVTASGWQLELFEGPNRSGRA